MSEPSSSIMKRPRASSRDNTTNLQHDNYTVAWISALPLEMTAAEAMLDTIHAPLSRHPQDSNSYTLGSINGHNVVMACLPKGQYGTNNAATVASHLTRSFLNIQYRLMVGIGGGASGSADVRLGDVVFQRIAYPIRPPQSLMTVVSKLQASHSRGTNHFLTIIGDSAADYVPPVTSKDCGDCDQAKVVARDARQNLDLVIYFGRIASGNQVIKDVYTRDDLSRKLGCTCFEMEAAGMMDSLPCLAICGVCDYSDSCKNKEWQEYAALVVALFESKSFGVLWKVFEGMIEKPNFRTVYCVIDALDECEPDSLRQLLTKFEQLSDPDNTSPKKVRLICLSRRSPERIPESLDLFTKIELDMMPAGKADVERFIAERVSTLAREKRMTGRLKARVEEVLQRKSEGKFLWVSFMAQELEQKRLQEIETSLNGLPAGLDAIYDRILSQIDRSKWDTVKRMLEWILVATRPLRVPELCDAACVTPTEFLTRGEVCRELIKSCSHLLQITKGEELFVGGQNSWADEKRPWRSAREVETLSNMFWSLSVTFLHQSAKDHYIKTIDPERNEGDSAPLARLHGSVPDQLTWSFCDISCAPPEETYNLTADRPLASYMTTSWHPYLEEADDIDDGQQTDINESWGEERRTPLQVATAEGNQNIINILLDANADVLVKDNRDENALFYAIRTGRIDINAKDQKGYNACSAAVQAFESPETKLQTLLEMGCDPNQPDYQGRIALHYSAMKPYSLMRFESFSRVVWLLLSQNGSQVNQF
ncbi:uncharacterized protein FIESC28_05883 [Fusarium coffeatum]|uniref:Nephrocystin 3-like N-terminal domain-containing protein n=1 Tax=Fusarium coffeatum TaxID=231269 RepID=A0A366RPL7_9HYPO|nr:uncharacterized protein FIESC28_05883 [Fusarium coffeatum]RBR18742.1 hypothetical protein FIESC28_05883 [Fusarium coffeatum]